MENFDFTQFISLDSDLEYDEIEDIMIELFGKAGFSIIRFDNMEEVKKEYYCEYWNKSTFELKQDDFLSDFMEWNDMTRVPESIKTFLEIIDDLLTYDVIEVELIICSFAEKMKTKNEIVSINRNKLIEELYKMSIYSYQCPDNLIIRIINCN